MPTIKSFNLLPCPFCGGEAVMVMYYDDNEDEWELYVKCNGTKCDVMPQTIHAYCNIVLDSITDKVINMWNKRGIK